MVCALPAATRSWLLKKGRMSEKLPHLHFVWAVGQALLSEDERAIIISFSHDWDQTCMKMDAVLASIMASIAKFALIYVVDITKVPDFITTYKLYDPCPVMLFFCEEHILIDLGTSNDSKINWALKDKQEFNDIVETAYRGARKGRRLNFPKGLLYKCRCYASQSKTSLCLFLVMINSRWIFLSTANLTIVWDVF
ncbi:hypothetical protein L7F22_029987 [Adiantum nelumboides]|nr:hypothetical protein [Adiantum nelumboides]